MHIQSVGCSLLYRKNDQDNISEQLKVSKRSHRKVIFKSWEQTNYVASDTDNKFYLHSFNVPCSHASIHEIWNTISLWILLIFRIILAGYFCGVHILPKMLDNFHNWRISSKQIKIDCEEENLRPSTRKDANFRKFKQFWRPTSIKLSFSYTEQISCRYRMKW